MEIRQHWVAVRQKLWQLPLKIVFPALGLAVILAAYAHLYFRDLPIVFDYAGDNCVERLTFLPGSVRQPKNSEFTILHQQSISIGGFTPISQQSCLQVQGPPQPGGDLITTSLWGGWLGRQAYRVDIPDPPKIYVNNLQIPIALSKAVTLPLSARDQVYSYALHANHEISQCQTVSASLECQLGPLNLEQGKEYQVAVVRYFNQTEVAKIEEVKTEILKAAKVVDTSINQSEVVYRKPQELEVSFDKPIIAAQAVMYRLDEKKQIGIELTTTMKKQKMTIAWEKELKRQAKYEVRISEVEAEDGSTLTEDYVLHYSTSGGPRVAGINIGTTGVSLGATVVISFDQALQASQDVRSMVQVNGSQASLLQQGDQFIVKFINAPRCQDITIQINDRVTSAYGIGGNSTWTHTARTVCHTVEVIGYSVQGRPIYAYFYGNGATTILYTGAIHGNELSSSYLVEHWMDELEANYHAIPSGRQIVVVPEVNPDGVANGTRYNANNVDLNRNFAVSDWRADVTDVLGNPLKNGGGAEPMSEPETRALADFTKRLQPRLTMSYHSIGGVVIANQAANSTALAMLYSQMTGYYHGTGQSSEIFDYTISGTYDDWIAESLGLPSVLVELGSHTYSQYPLNKEAMWKMAAM